jgi:hypothetical protein
MVETFPSREGRPRGWIGPSFQRMEPWQRAGVTHEEWVAARLQAAALMQAVEKGDPEAVAYLLTRAGSKDVTEGTNP